MNPEHAPAIGAIGVVFLMMVKEVLVLAAVRRDLASIANRLTSAIEGLRCPTCEARKAIRDESLRRARRNS